MCSCATASSSRPCVSTRASTASPTTGTWSASRPLGATATTSPLCDTLDGGLLRVTGVTGQLANHRRLRMQKTALWVAMVVGLLGLSGLSNVAHGDDIESAKTAYKAGAKH